MLRTPSPSSRSKTRAVVMSVEGAFGAWNVVVAQAERRTARRTARRRAVLDGRGSPRPVLRTVRPSRQREGAESRTLR
jgi:hypothetical protein